MTVDGMESLPDFSMVETPSLASSFKSNFVVNKNNFGREYYEELLSVDVGFVC